ncbi:AraC family transcriptional regulator [Marinomonas sp. PE14-40]|uniref:AraC family transcriptional regulator n=1 Tax=Marinomonas sp. PE14-40 TaxID=3060621 RepID=UPI003F67839B
MKYQTLPKALYTYPGVKKIFYDNQSCILFKKLSHSLLNQEKIATSHCFMYIISGQVEVKTKEGNAITTQAGEVLFMPRDTYLISDFVAENNTLELYLIFIGHETIDVFLNSTRKASQEGSGTVPVPSVCMINVSNSIKHYFNGLNAMYLDVENNREILNLKLLEFLHLINIDDHQNIVATLYASEQCKRKRNIASLMLENYKNNLTVTDFADLSGRSLSTFNRDFKRKYGMSPKQWLIGQKITAANTLLENGMNVTNSALEVGYSNVSHFIKAYKSVYGRTPKEIKKKTI